MIAFRLMKSIIFSALNAAVGRSLIRKDFHNKGAEGNKELDSRFTLNISGKRTDSEQHSGMNRAVKALVLLLYFLSNDRAAGGICLLLFYFYH